jgi:hypothetical protein
MRFICTNFAHCSVYVYGASSKVCPGCGEEGKRMPQDLDTQFLEVFHEVQSS